MEDLLQKAVIHLIQEERFYAEMLLLATRQFRTDIPTLGVNVTDNVNFHFNPYFWNNHTTLEQVDMLKHECDHVLKNHFARFKDLEPQIFDKVEKEGLEGLMERIEKMQEFHVLNAAGDYENNEFLPNLPKKVNFFNPDGTKMLDPDTGQPLEGGLLFVRDLMAKDPNIKTKQNLEYYYEWLKKNMPPEEQGAGAPGGMGTTLDDHSLWQEGNQSKEYVTEKIKSLVNKALEATIAAGEKPSNDILKDINALNFKPKDWRADLQRFYAKLLNILRESSRKVRNRRYGLWYPGHRNFPQLTLCLVIDTSGSVWDDLLCQFLAEIEKIASMGVRVIVIECDAKVHSITEFDPKKKIEIKGRGGTLFKPAFDAANELEIDGLIYLTDGDNFDIDKVVKPKYPVLWALPPGCTTKYPWGSKTEVRIKKVS